MFWDKELQSQIKQLLGVDELPHEVPSKFKLLTKLLCNPTKFHVIEYLFDQRKKTDDSRNNLIKIQEES